MNHSSRGELLKSLELIEALDRTCSRLAHSPHFLGVSVVAKTRAKDQLEKAMRAAVEEARVAARDYAADADTDPQTPAAQGSPP